MSTLSHLVVRAPNWVGDVVMATPVLAAAVRDPRFGRVSIAIREHLVDVLGSGPLEPHLLPIASKADELRLYREQEVDGVLLLTNSPGAAWRAFRARVPLRAGTALGGRGMLLTHRVVPPTRGGRRVPVPTAHLYRDVAGLLGIHPPDLHPVLHTSAAERAENAALLERLGVDPSKGYHVCAPGAAFGAAKLWPPEYHATVLDTLHRRSGRVAVVTGGPGEEPAIDAVVAACRHPAVGLSREARSLGRLRALIESAAFLLVGDSGPRWYAAAFDVPCVSIMGPNFPELTATSLDLCEVVRRDDLECQPCIRRVCPLEHHACMRGLAPERAAEAAERVLALVPVRA